MVRLLLVCAGGALGSGLRWLTVSWAAATWGASFPRGTLIVNLAGSFLLAVLMTVALAGRAVSDDVRIFLAAGVLGGFTTYSSFNWETLALLDDGRPGLAALNLVLTMMGRLLMGLAGAYLARRWVG
ncbi:MAG: fluoride efflux transporter CrcB [Anaeromyxobacter sp.]